MVNEKKDARLDKAQKRRRERKEDVPDFQGRTGDVRNNKKYKKVSTYSHFYHQLQHLPLTRVFPEKSFILKYFITMSQLVLLKKNT